MSSTVQPSTFLPGGISSLYNNNLTLAPPYIFVIILGCLIFILIVLIIIREILKSRGILKDCCNWQETGGIQCLGCQECCASCAETCDCCQTTSIESCFDACCPKRGSLEFADIITCEACCGERYCGECCGANCICAPTDVSNVNCLCCAIEQQPDMDGR
ncbi:unnamed protein product [Rotaria sordida]|uniref:Uncharacterized protein n=1 Tax=Rotaria sordida TaxID=392033 RepID=A0A814BHK8_9BILA|nr:unnamed protein product [Rotaria sordida]CAF0899250.1 unnamed protein product [Rotaria sordida]CAF0910922.1 unnamed protein product [Rotaria sordida]CAF0929767.1 unnamed protein product [Rotaria sordida]CAF1054653.1 unnamed protein product [Rotaria sordida]